MHDFSVLRTNTGRWRKQRTMHFFDFERGSTFTCQRNNPGTEFIRFPAASFTKNTSLLPAVLRYVLRAVRTEHGGDSSSWTSLPRPPIRSEEAVRKTTAQTLTPELGQEQLGANAIDNSVGVLVTLSFRSLSCSEAKLSLRERFPDICDSGSGSR